MKFNYTQEIWATLSQLTYSCDLLNAGICVHIHVTDPFAVSHHWDSFSSFLDIPDQLWWTSWNDEIYQLIQTAEIFYFLSGVHLG